MRKPRAITSTAGARIEYRKAAIGILLLAEGVCKYSEVFDYLERTLPTKDYRSSVMSSMKNLGLITVGGTAKDDEVCTTMHGDALLESYRKTHIVEQEVKIDAH